MRWFSGGLLYRDGVQARGRCTFDRLIDVLSYGLR